MKLKIAVWTLLLTMAATTSWAQSVAPASGAPDDATHDELRALKQRLEEALRAGDVEQMLTCVHPDVVITWQNAQVGRGHAGIRNFVDKMMKGPNPVVKSYKPEATTDELTKLYGGDTGVAFGSAIDRFELTNGMKIDLNDRWTAVVVKQDGKWVIAALHVSTNVFDNPLLAKATRVTYWAGGICLIVGGILGFFFGRRCKRAA